MTVGIVGIGVDAAGPGRVTLILQTQDEKQLARMTTDCTTALTLANDIIARVIEAQQVLGHTADPRVCAACNEGFDATDPGVHAGVNGAPTDLCAACWEKAKP